MMFALWGACNLVLISVFLIRGKLRRRRPGSRRRLIFAQLALAMLALAAVFWVSCETSIYTNVIQPSTINGTPTGNYTITILGTYTGSTAGIGVTTGTQTTVIRETSVNLVVQ
jgi:drug/metabolite transporter (DMT)-like permease